MDGTGDENIRKEHGGNGDRDQGTRGIEKVVNYTQQRVARRTDVIEEEQLGERLEKAFEKFPNGCWDQCKCGDNQQCDIKKGWEELATFEGEYKSRLSASRLSSSKENLFHLMAKDKNWSRAWTLKQKRFLSWMLQERNHHAMLQTEDQQGCTPMHNALSNEVDDFVNGVLDAEGLNIIEVLKKETSMGNCLHFATRHQFPNLSAMIDKCISESNTLMAQNRSGKDTPLHIAVQKLHIMVERVVDNPAKQDPDKRIHMQQSDSDKHHEEFEELRNRDYQESGKQKHKDGKLDLKAGCASNPDEKHYNGDANCASYWLETNKEREQRLRNILEDLDKETARPRPPPKTLNTKDPNDSASQAAKQGQHCHPEKQRVHIQPGIQDTATVIPDVMELSRLHSAREQALLNDPVVSGLISKYAEKGTAGSEEARKRVAQRMMLVKDPVAHYIRSYCMRNYKSREETMSSLYQPGQERHIEFDLAGIPTSVIPLSYLEQLANHLRFESLLKYVALPILTVEVPAPRERKAKSRTLRAKRSSELQALPNGRSDLVVVFDWLWQMGVREIIKVMVVDDRDRPHADSAIVEALYGFKVEEWDWKRVDLCSDIIYESSQNVREVSLYSSGNNAVLMGWASAEGLGNRDKFPYLEKVNLFVQDGLEDMGRRQWNTKRCADIIKSNLQAKSQRGKEGAGGNGITVNVVADNNKVGFSSQFSNSTRYIDEAPSWLKCIEDFSTFLKNASMTQSIGNQVAPVKIAIIDDGIDATVADLQPRITGGATFCPYPHSPELVNSYFVPSGKHGTLMAQLICDICPDSQLYIARLEELPALTGSGRRVTARSAAKAVEWAINCGVSIISMSWTIQTTAQDNQDMRHLQAAINKAASANILMFCSASDQGGNTNESCYPGDWGQCLRIGGATFAGDKLTWVDDKVNFWFPGRNVPFPTADGKSVTYESGSSVATAAASGLAGVLIYCAGLVSGAGLVNSNEVCFQDRDALQKAFENMAIGKDGKFPRVDNIFRRLFREKLHQQDSTLPENLDIATLAWDNVSKHALLDLLRHIQGK